MISFNASQSKEELYSLALEHNVAVDESMKKTEIINAIQAYNNDLSESDTQEPEVENLSKSDKPQKEDEDSRTFVYVGPSLPNGVLTSKAAFVGTRVEVEKYLEKAIESYPQVKKLLVPYEKTATMSNRAKQRGNTTYNDCLAVASAVAENRKKQQKRK